MIVVRYVFILRRNNCVVLSTLHVFLFCQDCSPSEIVRENPLCDRSVYLYGYLRGCNLRQNARVHVAGVGDYTLEEIDGILDPCPFPEALKKRGLNEKERVMYAPMSNLGGFVYDKDAVYIDIPDWKVRSIISKVTLNIFCCQQGRLTSSRLSI